MATSKRNRSTSLLVCGCAALAAYAIPAGAQSQRSGGSANTQLMQQLQQLGSERTALQSENARMKKELAELTKERDSLKAGRAALTERAHAGEAAVARSRQEKESADAENEKLKERMQELIAKFRETAQTLREVEAERTNFKQTLVTRDAELTGCIDKNRALYELNGEVLTRLDGEGIFSRMARAEPFTKLKRVQLENLIEDYKYRAEDQKVTTAPPPPIEPAPTPAARGADTAQSTQAAAAGVEHR